MADHPFDKEAFDERLDDVLATSAVSKKALAKVRATVHTAAPAVRTANHIDPAEEDGRDVCALTGTHAHMATCCKGNNGRQGCRFGAPFPHDVPRGGGSAGAQIVQLASAASGDGEGTIMAACTRANSVPMLLGVGDAGKAAGYYMLKYMGKPLCDPAASLDVFVAAAQHVSDPGRASTAADAHTSRRTALHFAERVLNASMQELEAPFAASIVVL